jgi:hypothetical protein
MQLSRKDFLRLASVWLLDFRASRQYIAFAIAASPPEVIALALL